MKDSHGRVIDYLRISLTDRCNLRCIYCMPAEGVRQVSHKQILTYDQIIDIVRVAAEEGIKHVRLTGGEPLVRKGAVDLVRDINGIAGIEKVVMTTNGLLLPRFAHELKEAGLSRVNISMDTLDSDKFRMVTRGGDVTEVLAGIDSALEVGFDPVKVNAVAVRSLDQDYLAFAKMSIDRPLHVRFIEYMPVGDSSGIEGCGWGPQDVISCEEIFDTINADAAVAGLPALQPVDENQPEGWGPAKYFAFPGAKGTVGFISPLSRHFCGECNRLRLTSEGMLRPCLFSDDGYDIMAAAQARDPEAIRAVILKAIGAKPEEHHEGDHANATALNMNQIGG